MTQPQHGWTRARLLRASWIAFAVFTPVVIVANIAVLAYPHPRGIGFMPPLRYAVLTPICAFVTFATVLLYQRLLAHATPRRALALAVAVAAAAVLLAVAAFGRSGLLGPATAVVIAIGLTEWAIVPWFTRRRRRRFGTVVTSVFGALAWFGVAAAVRSEGRRLQVDDIPRSLFDVDHKFVDLPSGSRVHYVDVGTGDTLLFLHGNPAWSFQWHGLIDGLRKSHRCVALDYPGFGLSVAPSGYGYTPREQSRVVEELVDHLGLRDVTLVIQDWGGPIGLSLAERRPELVRQVIAGNTWAWRTATSEPRGRFSQLVGGPLGEFVQMNFNGFVPLALSASVVATLPATVKDGYVRPFQAVDRRGVAAFYPGQITAAADYFEELEAGLGRLSTRRALIFWGMQDRGFPRSDLERMERVFPDHRTIELDNASHFFFEDAPERVVAEIESFMASSRPFAGPAALTP